MKFSIIIPTYKNPEKIKTCLSGLDEQTQKADETIILYYSADRETKQVLSEERKKTGATLIPIPLKQMSRMPAVLNAGIRRSSGNIICFLDEDVVPERKWLSKLAEHFANPDIAACGGKDIITFKERKKEFQGTDEVGILKWKGYIVGNQHRGTKNRQVMFLKGCNMAVRRQHLRQLDENLIGRVRWEQDIFFPIAKSGTKVIYDPEIIVEHRKNSVMYPDPIFAYWYGHNTAYLFMKHLKRMDRILPLLFYWLIGDVSAPGFLRFPISILRGNENSLWYFAASQIGKIKAVLFYLMNGLK